MIYIASDHGGYKLKESIKVFLIKQKIEYVDLGPDRFQKDDDYPDYAKKVAAFVSKNSKTDVGILICRSGQGMAIAANKFRGVRASLVWNTKEAKASRNDDMANILVLPSDYISLADSFRVVKTWLSTPFSKEARHIRRVKKLSALEK